MLRLHAACSDSQRGRLQPHSHLPDAVWVGARHAGPVLEPKAKVAGAAGARLAVALHTLGRLVLALRGARVRVGGGPDGHAQLPAEQLLAAQL